jgi:hypothetical protein
MASNGWILNLVQDDTGLMPDFNSQFNDENSANRRIKISEWYFEHKILLKRIFIGFLIAVSAGFWFYSSVAMIDWAFVSGPSERANLKTLTEISVSPEALDAVRAESVIFGETQIFAGGVGQYDAISSVKNPNAKWWEEFEYRFTGDGLEGQWKKGFALPQDEKYLVDLGLQLPFHPRNVYLQTRNLKYHRINNHEIPNYDVWKKEQMNFILSDKNYNPNFLAGSKGASALTFKVLNDSAYNFWSVGFYALLYRGDQLASVNYANVTNFMSEETRDAQIGFYEGLPTITKFEIIPEVNIFDPAVYISQR